jgi:hypothetical protein
MCRANKKLEVRLRLGEIKRRSAELSAVSSELADMVAQLDRLRKLDERIGTGILSIANRTGKRNSEYLSGTSATLDAGSNFRAA